ncbi:hypothetical protein M427DRAFT_210861 [Gonapodya prolifera JEL478]|uniref:Uncharacterized protein n=1 Tax=Gonapodya prolifera (strain JEL478) TaxID=1344416 RepID=A0A139ANW8_GONPJ|nr:hypothetical protein M427DRAFT_210861 [Gonapodya prolifera JEL478]|eukprot:KXS18451.1 hypothetical protein M427DRAFT_210861 [Gonapodya prolifera JEL478]
MAFDLLRSSSSRRSMSAILLPASLNISSAPSAARNRCISSSWSFFICKNLSLSSRLRLFKSSIVRSCLLTEATSSSTRSRALCRSIRRRSSASTTAFSNW